VYYFDRPYPASAKPLWYDVLLSLRPILIGFAAGVVASAAIGAAMSANQVIRHLIDPAIEVIRPLLPLPPRPLPLNDHGEWVVDHKRVWSTTHSP
jgi:ABC-type nitrate/sulfonate/bicarbonate transport system permease component